MINSERDKALTKAKLDLLIHGSKFLATITFNVEHKWCNDIRTACTNGKCIKYNPQFFMSLNPQSRIFVLAHETWHIALKHMTRLGSRDPNVFNQAADYVTNLLLVNAGYRMPTDTSGKPIGLLNRDYEGMSTEQVYDILIQDPSKQETCIMEGDIDRSADLSEDDIKELEATITMTVVKAIAASKVQGEAPGAIPGEIRRLIDEAINPKLPWERLLERFLTDSNKNDYTWKRPNKRFFPDFILPSLYSDSLGHIAIAIDTSGSLDDTELASILCEINHIHRKFKPSKLTLLGCDYKLHNRYTISPNEKITNLKFTGKGGTSFQPVFDHLEGKSPIALIYFTDLHARPITKKPRYPVLWVCNSNHEPAKIGKTIYLK